MEKNFFGGKRSVSMPGATLGISVGDVMKHALDMVLGARLITHNLGVDSRLSNAAVRLDQGHFQVLYGPML